MTAYGAAAAAIGLDSLAAGAVAPFLPFGSSVSLVAAGLILIFWPALAPVAARVSAFIFGVWAIAMKAPLLFVSPGDEAEWLACFGLLALAIIGLKLAGECDGWEAARGETKDRAIAWLYPAGAPLAAHNPGYQGSGG